MFFMLVVMTINTKEFPVAAVRRIILMVVILVVNRQFLQFSSGKLAAAATADMRKELEGPGAISLLSFRHITLNSFQWI